MTNPSESVKLFLIFGLNIAQIRRLTRYTALLALIQLFCYLLFSLDELVIHTIRDLISHRAKEDTHLYLIETCHDVLDFLDSVGLDLIALL